MRSAYHAKSCAVAVAGSLLASCGGAGGPIGSAPSPTAAAPTPAPASSPSPAPTASSTQLTILSQPATQEFASYSDGDPMRVRYDAGSNTYEVNYTDAWQKLFRYLRGYPGEFLIGGATVEASSGFGTASTSDSAVAEWRYQYSSLATWSDGRGQRRGHVVFGTATPPTAVPVTGTATYSGKVVGTTSASADGGGWGIIENPTVDGTIAMEVDFGRGRLAGTVSAGVYCDCASVPEIPRMTFDGQLASGAASLSGRFATDVAGANSFEGLLAGPAAQEAIGGWAFPFVSGGKVESASGVWIARKD